MHPHNHWYGGGHVLLTHALGKRRWTVPSIAGHLQHEWDIAQVCEGDRALNPSLTAYLWSSGSRRRRAATGLRNHVVIGAPWLYLRDLDPKLLTLELSAADELKIAMGGTDPRPKAPTPPTGDLVLFAEHGLDGEFAARRLAAQVREQEDGAVTVALSHRDFAVPAVRAVYREAGFTAHDLGPLPDASGTPQPRYLDRLQQLLTGHRRAGANAARSELLYAADLDLPVRVFGTVPPALRPLTAPADAAAFAADELGREFLLSPAELKDVLEWSGRV
ncbi:hypothetical protein [Flexivirga meconopsidis]|uniref:hypothetical protein n=1 Tax=Flexivirga meconopsidis TaxID=2977121 RepID=UPI00223EB3CA|nr:hypothetical protein [Flexivirga meconopsidis]